jgi:hypothetical protein
MRTQRRRLVVTLTKRKKKGKERLALTHTLLKAHLGEVVNRGLEASLLLLHLNELSKARDIAEREREKAGRSA